MAGKKIILVDTDIFIKVFRGDIRHRNHLNALAGRIAVSVVTILELYQGANSVRKKYELEKQIRAYNILLIDEKISAKAVWITKKYLPKKQLYPPDCLIAATAITHGMELFTDNKVDFDFIKEIKLYKP